MIYIFLVIICVSYSSTILFVDIKWNAIIRSKYSVDVLSPHQWLLNKLLSYYCKDPISMEEGGSSHSLSIYPLSQRWWHANTNNGSFGCPLAMSLNDKQLQCHY